MYSDKKNVLQLVSLLKEYEINDIVLCPGSRNSPIVHTLANHPFFHCYAVTDERSAGFFAMGLALQSNKPTVVCCTSGTALLNIHPAIAEAYYQQIPLIVISADRPAAWIGQMDGQTLPQPNVFGTLVKKSVNLPEIQTLEDEWYCNRLINEALLELNHHGKGPIHINIALSEPLFQYTAEKLPATRVISRYYHSDVEDLFIRLKKYNKQMMIIGQTNEDYFEKDNSNILSSHFALLAEHLNNQIASSSTIIKNVDTLLYALPEDETDTLVPDLIITFGGHIVSKRLKKFLRSNPPKEHWHISTDGNVVDLYCSLTAIVEMKPAEFLTKMIPFLTNNSSEYPNRWKNLSESISEPEIDYSEISAIGDLIKSLPENSVLHLGNSSVVRYAQLFSISNSIKVFCNRGTAGIEGSLSTAVGFAASSEKLNYVVIGDLSFFYDMNALWNNHIKSNLRILLLNNGGGEIFQALPGLDMTEQTHRFVTGTHSTSAKGWAIERGFQYTDIHNQKELKEALKTFTQSTQTEKPMLLEVFTDKAEDVRLLKEYYQQIKVKSNR